MNRRWRNRLLGAALVILLSVISAASWMLATESGTRWLLARAKPFLPESLTIGEVGGSVFGGLQAYRLRWRDESVDVLVDNATVAVRLLPLLSTHILIEFLDIRGLEVSVLEAESPTPPRAEPISISLPVSIDIQAAHIRDIRLRYRDVDRAIESLDLTGSIDGSSLKLDRLDLRSSWVTFNSQSALLLEPPYAGSLAAEWQLPDLAEEPLAGALRLDGDTNGYRLSHSLSAPASVETEATITFPNGEIAIDAVNRWTEWNLSLADGRTVHTRDARFAFRGGAADYSFDGRVDAQLDDWPIVNIEAQGTGTIDGLAFEYLRAQSSAGNLSLSGNTGWGDGVRWDLLFELTDVLATTLVETLSGSIDATGLTAGHWSVSDPLQSDLRIDQLAGTLNGYPLAGAMTASLNDGQLSVPVGEVVVEGNILNFGGTLGTSPGDRFDVALDWSAPDLGALDDAAGGSSVGQLRAVGTETSWAVDASASGSEIRWDELRIGEVNVEGAFGADRSGSMSLDATAVALGEQNLESIGANVSGTPAAHTISSHVTAYGLRAAAELAGALDERDWRGRIDSFNASGDVLGSWSSVGPVSLAVAGGGLALEQLCLAEASGNGRACAAVGNSPGGPLDISASISGLPLAALPLGLPAAVTIVGELEVNASVHGQDGIFAGEAVARLPGAAVSAVYDGETVTAAAQQAEVRAELEDNRLTSSIELLLKDGFGRFGLSLSLADVTLPDSQLEASAEIAVDDLSFAPLMVPAVANADGRVNGRLNIGGHLSAPDYRGSVRLEDGAFQIPVAGISVSDVHVALSQSVPGRLKIDGSARSGEGQVSIAGFTQIAGEGELSAELRVDGDDFQIARLPNWQVSASPSVLVEVDPDLTKVTGAIVIPHADLEFKSLPESANVPSTDAVVHGRDDPTGNGGRRRSIDLEATLGDDVTLSGFGLTTGMSGSVRLQGGTRTPLIGTGRLDLYDGRYQAYGQELEIERGALTFNGPLENPVLDVRAVRRTNDVVAGISLAGTPRSPQSSVFSEPAMSDAEILSYLITGRPLNSASAGEGEILGQAAFALGLTGAGAIATQIGNTLGLDTLAVDGNADTGRIIAGKRLGNRLLVEYGYGLVDKLGTLLLRYELNDRVIIESSAGSTSALDVVYSIKKK